MKTIYPLILSLVLLSGCIGDIKQGKLTDNSVNTRPITVNVPSAPTTTGNPSAEVVPINDIPKLKQDLTNEIHTTAIESKDQLSGYINLAMGKLTDKLTGIESKIDVTNSAEFKAQLKDLVHAEIQTELKVTNSAVADIKADLKSEIKDNAANGQVGLSNEMQSLKNDIKTTMNSTAGRDVNMLPAESVKLILYVSIIVVMVVIAMCALGAYIVSKAYKNSNDREVLRAQDERDERKQLSSLLQACMAYLPPHMATQIAEIVATPSSNPK